MVQKSMRGISPSFHPLNVLLCCFGKAHPSSVGLRFGKKENLLWLGEVRGRRWKLSQAELAQN